MRQLTLIRDGQKVAEYLLDMPDVIIGRGQAAHVRLDGNPVVSRQHAVVRERGTGHIIEDLGGANGTFIDGRKIKSHSLRAGQRIVLGADTLRYDFGHRGAQSLRDISAPVPTPDDHVPTFDSIAEISVADVQAFSNVEEIGDIGKFNRERGAPAGAVGEHTTVADKDDLERMLAELTIKAKPHLIVYGDDEDPEDPEAGTLLALGKPPVLIGHTDACRVRLPGKRWLLPGKIAGRLTVEAGRWHLSADSPFWNPVYLGDDKLVKIRMLSPGDEFEAGGITFVYRKGV